MVHRHPSEDSNVGGSNSINPTPTQRRTTGPMSVGTSGAGGASSTYGHGDMESLAAKLKDPTGDIKTKIHLAMELRETVDLYQRDMEFSKHLDVIISAAVEILTKTKPAFVSTAWDYKFRYLLLDILHRIPMHEIMRPHALDVMNLLIYLIRNDNAESVTICFKLGVDLYRSFKTILEPTVTPFFNTIIEMYDMVPQTCEELFGDVKIDPTQVDGCSPSPSESTPTSQAEPSTPKSTVEATRAILMRRTGSGTPSATNAPGFSASDQNATDVVPGMKSFKALQECPVAVVFLLQTFKLMVQATLTNFIPIIFKFLKTSPTPQVQWHKIISERGQGPFVGIAPVIIKAGKRTPYTDLVVAQVKIMSFIAYVLRAQTPAAQPLGTDVPDIVIRMLKDIPPESSPSRRELIIAARHILNTDYRSYFLPFLNDLMDIRVWLGTGVTSHESLRHLVYSTIAELIQQTKTDLTAAQLESVLMDFMSIMHDPTATSSTQGMASRVILNIVEYVAPPRFEPQEALRVCRWLSENFVRKMEALAETRSNQLMIINQRRQHLLNLSSAKETIVKPEIQKSKEILDVKEVKDDEQAASIPADKERKEFDQIMIEKAKMLGCVMCIVEPAPDHSKDISFGRRHVIRCCIGSFNTMISNLKKMEAPLPDASLLGRLLIAGVRCFNHYDCRRELKEIKEIVDNFIFIFTQINLLLFTEVLEPNMDALVHEFRMNMDLMTFPQYMLTNPTLTKTCVGITLRYLMKHLEDLGRDRQTGVMVRLFKMCFMAVTLYQDNEVVLQPHLSDLIMDSLQLASESKEPSQYYSVLRALFRSIGGGRFEILYKEVLPLLQILLEELNKLLNATNDPKERDLFAELCLTVPVRLSVLLPYLSYLMRPLVIALQAIPDLVSQGLRTLELCVDNLTQEFLNPLMAPVIHEVMVALWKLLKPLPYNPQHAPTALRILGKLGGRNRKVLGPTQIDWKPIQGPDCYLPIKLAGQERSITLPPIVELSARMMKRNDIHYRKNGYEFLINITPVFLTMGYGRGEREETFTILLKGLFDATRVPEFAENAKQHLVNLFEHIFMTEIWQEAGAGVDRLRYSLTLTNLVMDGLLDNLAATTDQQHFAAASQFTLNIFKRLFEKAKENPPPREEVMLLAKRTLCSKASSCCYDNSWHKKCAGHEILSHFLGELEMELSWITDHELEMVRALLFLHKDAPTPAEKFLQGPSGTLLKLLKLCNFPSENDEKIEAKTKLNYLVGLLVIELCSQVSGVRQVAQAALQLISELKSRPLYELVLPARERLTPIFGKPLRALAFPMQIGHLDALTYCIRLEPPLFEYNDQMSRMLQEAVGIADADDVALVGRTNHAKTAKALIDLRVVCLRFLAASLRLPDMKDHPATKAKILSIYFQSLYAKTPQVVDAAHASLKELLLNGGSRLPKDLLQNGLRPVLNNLSDHKKLTIPSLQGLARLVELLTNYFKVEIGSKLLEHFKQLSDPSTLAAAALASSQDSGMLQIMAGVINIFHLLACPAAGIYLADLISNVVHVEKILRKVTASPFTKPLALYVDLYPEAAARYFFQHLEDERFVSTLKWIILSDHSPRLRTHLQATALEWLQQSFARDCASGLHGATILQQLTIKDPEFTANSVDIIHLISQRWVSEARKSRLSGSLTEVRTNQMREDAILLEIMMSCVKIKPASNIDLLFHMADVLGGDRSVEYCYITRFYYDHVLTSSDVVYKCAILNRFLDIVNNSDVTPTQKTAILRHIINPLLLVAFGRGSDETAIVDAEYISKVHRVIWSAFIPNSTAKVFASDDKLDIEMLHMSSLIIEHRHHLVSEQRKEIIKFGWRFLNVKDDQMVTNVAYILIARFIDAFESPTKIVSQILSGLLKLHGGEAKHLVHKALDILLPALPKRYKENPTDWVRLMRKTLIEEGQNIPFLCNFYAAVVRKPEPFYPHRELFVPQFAAAMPKMAVSANANGETRALVVDLIDVIIRWEQQRAEPVVLKDEDTRMTDAGSTVRGSATSVMDIERDRPSSAKRLKLDRSGSAAPSVAGSDHTMGTYVVPYSIREGVVSILIRIIASASETSSKSVFVARALSLIKLILTEVWHEVEVKLNFFQRALSTEFTDATAGSFCNTAEVLNMVVTNKNDEWLLTNLAVMQTLVEKGVTAKHPDILKIQRGLLHRLFRVLPTRDSSLTDGENKERSEKQEKIETDVANFEAWASRMIRDGLKETRPPETYFSTLALVEAWDQANPMKVNAFIPEIVRVFQRMYRDHLTAAQTDGGHQSAEQARHLLEKLLDLMKMRIPNMTGERRWLLSGLVTLIEKSPSIGLCRYILRLQRQWIENKDEFPTIKEKATLLLKTMSYDSKGDDELLTEYLQLILDIYVSPNWTRSEYTVRLEPAFLLGCRSRDAATRTKFMEVFDNSIRREPFARLHYLTGVQNWEALADVNWMHHALDLFLGVVDTSQPVLLEGRLPLPSGMVSRFAEWAEGVNVKSIITATRQVLYADPAETEKIWISLFQAAWSTFTKREQADLTRFLVILLSKEHLVKAIDRRPNTVQILLSGIRACNPTPILPPHLIRYLGKTYTAWHIAIEHLQEMSEEILDDEANRETVSDALAQLYGQLGETDLFYGQWRRKALCVETNAALSYEQIGEWGAAEQAYEVAQERARANLMTFGKGEYSLWEDHWVLCAQKMQQWDFLSDLARIEQNSELLLECQWRQSDWAIDHANIQLALDASPGQSIRKITFRAYLALLKNHMGIVADDHKAEFNRLCDEGIQLALQQWFQLPDIVTEAHVPLMQSFQQFVELQEAAQIFASLQTTTAQNLDVRSADLKHVLNTWRERLPNTWDDINIWSDLVAWRQHVFTAVNKAYLPLVQSASQSQGANASSFAYRGFHETAWIINQFAHVARKHHLHAVCIASLTKIYTLPNIEIREAFLKLREQAKCHYQNPSEWTQGLDVLSNTNLMYFQPAQKAEFHTLKAMFLSRLNLHEDAQKVFNQAIGSEFQFGKSWAEWGAYQDRTFSEQPQSLHLAAGAISCYLQASGLYKNGKVRRLLIRILWLLAFDDAAGTIGKAFEKFQGDIPIWHWTFFIPQLLTSLSAQREARYAKALLTKIAKSFPQSLFFYIRAMNDELGITRQRALSAVQRAAMAASPVMTTETNQASQTPVEGQNQQTAGKSNPIYPSTTIPSAAVVPHIPMAFEHVDEIMSALKTQFPLLALSMEMLVDQLYQRFKPTGEEEIHKLITALLQDALMMYVERAGNSNDDLQLPEGTKVHLAKFSENLGKMPLQPMFHREFVECNPSIPTYVHKLQEWRNKYEANIERKVRKSALENASHWMVEFQYQKFDEVEVPGQYVKRFREDNNAHFIKIARFVTTYGVQRQKDQWYRRISLIGHDASKHTFIVQMPLPRASRREERIMQFFRMLNCPLSRKKQSRSRDVTFVVPVVVPFAANIRIMESDQALCSLQDIYETHCTEAGFARDDPIVAYVERMRSLSFDGVNGVDSIATKLEIADEISAKLIPDCLLKNYMSRTMKTAGDLWYFRKRTTIQYASFIFMTYIFSMSERTPARIYFDRSSGQVQTTHMYPTLSKDEPEFAHTEPVPFRLTPNIQTFLTRPNIEGLLTGSIMAIAQALTEHEHEMDLPHRLSIFVRDEIVAWNVMRQIKLAPDDPKMMEMVMKNLDNVVKRARLLACEMETKTIDPQNPQPVCQSITELINQATSLPKLFSMHPSWMPWL
ncbi:hypothetical protein CROQUDRAFT_656816 [Cronartium quercuum f. sp. fusiforme G11]|uniref:Non-specific serine/threonine protein kinase n=1 Tax=Cronartium quercuum f. sp. fusiforme G11 TaxID=708437 RepID=A0A9P6NMM7_9BASI|nr:hypothetical protein CROQUDRAFT_656816 [Cronartium quercuum f. sp. fusiforme G11]